MKNLHVNNLWSGAEPEENLNLPLKQMLLELMEGVFANPRRLPFFNINQNNQCWEWLGPKSDGYGKLTIKHRKYRAHRVFYEKLVGPIPQKMVIDHLCRNRGCVNPNHLEVVTNQINTQRAFDYRKKMGLKNIRKKSK